MKEKLLSIELCEECIAEDLMNHIREAVGIITMEDMANYRRDISRMM